MQAWLVAGFCSSTIGFVACYLAVRRVSDESSIAASAAAESCQELGFCLRDGLMLTYSV